MAVLSCAEQNQQPEALQHYRKVDEIPFDFVRRRMSVVVAKDNEYHELVCKGALEEMLAICSHVRHEDEVIPLSEALLVRIRRITDDLNQQGLRVVAVANKILPAQTHEYGVADESDLILEGYVAFLDPPKESTAPALAALKQNGVTVKILTGDNELVAAKVCRDVGLAAEHLLRGSEIEQMDDEQLAQAAARTTVFAKLTPLHKERIVKPLRRRGTWWALWATASTTRQRCARPISASPSIRRWTSPRKRRTSSCWKSLMVLEQGNRRAPYLRQHAEIHQDDRQLQLR